MLRSKLGKLHLLARRASSAFIETAAFVGLVLPGETVVILGGAVAGQGETLGHPHHRDRLGLRGRRRLGQLPARQEARPRLRHASRAEGTDHARALRPGGGLTSLGHGGKTILVGRFIGLVRALAPFVAGSSGMRYTGFLPYSVLGTGLWAAGYVLLGYFASRSLDAAAHAAGQGTLFFGIAVVVIVGIVWAVRFLRDPANRERLVAGMEERSFLRPLVALGRRIQPQAPVRARADHPWRARARVHDARGCAGGLGLLVVAYTSTISAHSGPTRRGDQGRFSLTA